MKPNSTETEGLSDKDKKMMMSPSRRTETPETTYEEDFAEIEHQLLTNSKALERAAMVQAGKIKESDIPVSDWQNGVRTLDNMMRFMEKYKQTSGIFRIATQDKGALLSLLGSVDVKKGEKIHEILLEEIKLRRLAEDEK